ncbi:MAG TPA: carboxypeptidase regulatory-like domain-containing protein [Bryobacteraceae bacterium]|nr:carboxypeptidase regulatory-like domain-containing protein [Bryobacteraceae bacterium]
MFFKKMALGAAAAILFAGLSFAQTTAISGSVKGEDGKGLKDALIKITRTDIKGNYKVKTNKKGEYYYGGLPLGNYNIVLEVNGQDVDTVNGVRTGLGEPKVIDFDLAQLKNKREALAKAAETGQLTQEQARELSPEQRAAMEKQMKERQAAMAKNKELNDAFNTGVAALEAKQYDAAIQSFTKAGELDPKQHVVWARLADAYMALGKTKTGQEQTDAFNKGVETWAKAISLNPTDGGYHNNYALALATAKRFEEAQAELEKAAQLDPPAAGKYFFNLGALYVNAGQIEPSGVAFKRAIEADPNYAEAYYQYGIYLMSKATTTADGKIVPPEGTTGYFEKYLQLAPNGPNAEGAKAMIATVQSTISTQYVDPNAKQKKGRKK